MSEAEKDGFRAEARNYRQRNRLTATTAPIPPDQTPHGMGDSDWPIAVETAAREIVERVQEHSEL